MRAEIEGRVCWEVGWVGLAEDVRVCQYCLQQCIHGTLVHGRHCYSSLVEAMQYVLTLYTLAMGLCAFLHQLLMLCSNEYL